MSSLDPAPMINHSLKRISELRDADSRRKRLWAQAKWISEAVVAGKVAATYELVSGRLIAAATEDQILSRESAEATAASGWAKGQMAATPLPQPRPTLPTRSQLETLKAPGDKFADVLAALSDPRVRDRLVVIVLEALETFGRTP